MPSNCFQPLNTAIFNAYALIGFYKPPYQLITP